MTTMQSKITVKVDTLLYLMILFAAGLFANQSFAEPDANHGVPAGDTPSIKVSKHLEVTDPQANCLMSSMGIKPPTDDFSWMTDTMVASGATPVWSPDGKLVATGSAIWSVQQESIDPTPLVKLKLGIWTVGFSPDGKKYAYLKRKFKEIDSGNHDGKKRPIETSPDLYVRDLRTGKERFVVSAAVLASWSPTGDRFAYFRYKDTEPSDIYNVELHVVKADGSHDRIVTDLRFPQGVFAVDPPVWSADGSKVAFEKDGDICVANADGSNLSLLVRRMQYHHSSEYIRQQIRRNPGQALPEAHDAMLQGIAWSTDKREVFFMCRPSTWGIPYAQGSSFAYANSESGEVTYLFRDNDKSDLFQSVGWSPDRTKLALLKNPARTKPFFDPADHSSFWIVDSDGSNLTMLTMLSIDKRQVKYGKTRSDLLLSGRNTRPAWSPEGKRIAVVFPEDPAQLHVFVLE